MAAPSAVTLGSLAVVFVAGAALAVVPAFGGSDGPSAASSSRPTATRSTSAPPSTVESPKAHHHKGGHKKRDEASDPVPKTLVDVYNNSGITGLAAEKASYLQGAGWNVAATDNWYGTIPANTVYYPPQLRDEAEQLAAALKIDRLHPAVAPMQFDRLTVIFTSQ